jgi:hypothetical protein
MSHTYSDDGERQASKRFARQAKTPHSPIIGRRSPSLRLTRLTSQRTEHGGADPWLGLTDLQ